MSVLRSIIASSSSSSSGQESSLEACKKQLGQLYLAHLIEFGFGEKTTACLIDYHWLINAEEITQAIKQSLKPGLSKSALKQIASKIYAERCQQQENEKVNLNFQFLIIRRFVFQHAAHYLREHISDPQELAQYLEQALTSKNLPLFTPVNHNDVLDIGSSSYLVIAQALAKEALNQYRRANNIPVKKFEAKFAPLPHHDYSKQEAKSLHQKAEKILKKMLIDHLLKSFDNRAAVEDFVNQFAESSICFKILDKHIDHALKHKIMFDADGLLYTLSLQMMAYAKQKEDFLAKAGTHLYLSQTKGQVRQPTQAQWDAAIRGVQASSPSSSSTAMITSSLASSSSSSTANQHGNSIISKLAEITALLREKELEIKEHFHTPKNPVRLLTIITDTAEIEAELSAAKAQPNADKFAARIASLEQRMNNLVKCVELILQHFNSANLEQDLGAKLKLASVVTYLTNPEKPWPQFLKADSKSFSASSAIAAESDSNISAQPF